MTSAATVSTKVQLRNGYEFAKAFLQLDYQLALYEAAQDGALDVVFLQREQAMPNVWKATQRNTPVVIVVIDTVGKPAGPSTWRAAAQLIPRADIAILQDAGGHLRHYAHAVELAKTYMRVLVIEAPAETVERWEAALSKRADLPLELLN